MWSIDNVLEHMEIISEKECDTNTHANKHACIIYMDNCMDKTCGVIYQKLNQCPENHINVHKQRYLNANRSLSALSKTYIFLNLKHSATTNFVLILPSTHSRTHTPTYTEQKHGSLQHWSMAEEKLSFQTGMLRVPKGRTWKKACARRVPKDTRQCSMWGQFRPDGKSGIKGPSSIIAHSPTNTVPFEERARPPVSSEKQLHSFLFT